MGRNSPQWRSEHAEVFEGLRNEPRDPLELMIQQLWVYIEMVKRETVEGDAAAAEFAHLNAREQLQKVLIRLKDQAPTSAALEQRVTRLKSELGALGV